MNGLALQAVLEQWTTKAGGNDHSTSPQSSESSLSSSFSNIYTQNESYIQEVIDSSRIILRHVVYDLLPDDHLKHAPVRAYFRIVSAAMFLLKVPINDFIGNLLSLSVLDLRPGGQKGRS